MEIISILHFIFSIIIAGYGFIHKSWFDYIFIFYIILLTISWTMFNGDCWISYYYIKQSDPSHTPGSTLVIDNDLSLIPFYYPYISNIITFGFIISFFVVCARQHISRYIFVPFVIGYISYIILLQIFKNLDADPLLYYIQRALMIFFIFILFTLTLSLH